MSTQSSAPAATPAAATAAAVSARRGCDRPDGHHRDRRGHRRLGTRHRESRHRRARLLHQGVLPGTQRTAVRTASPEPAGRHHESGRSQAVDNTVTEKIAGRLGSGVYTVGWRVVAPDGHPVSGEYRFTVTGTDTGAPAPPAHVECLSAHHHTRGATGPKRLQRRLVVDRTRGLRRGRRDGWPDTGRTPLVAACNPTGEHRPAGGRRSPVPAEGEITRLEHAKGDASCCRRR